MAKRCLKCWSGAENGAVVTVEKEKQGERETGDRLLLEENKRWR